MLWIRIVRIAAWLSLSLGFVSCASLPKDFAKPDSYSLTDTSDTTLGERAKKLQGLVAGPSDSGLHLLGSGHDAFVARAVLCQKAERSIDAQYYILHDDLTGNLFIEQLIEAADRGVRVRLLVDDMGMGLSDELAAALDSHPHMEVRLFNPFSRNVPRPLQVLTRFNRSTRRMHNKSFTADSQVSILGGRNIGDEYFAASTELNFGDLDTLVVGPAVQEVNASFDTFWNSPLAYPATAMFGAVPDEDQITGCRKNVKLVTSAPEAAVYREALKESELAQSLRNNRLKFHWGMAEVVADSPEKIEAKRSETEFFAAPKLKPYFENTERELLLISPYFVPTRRGADLLIGLARRGVRVKVLTNSLAATDVAAVHAGYKKYRKELLREGIELFELDDTTGGINRQDLQWLGGSSKASLHAKSFVFDREKIFVGSFNFDPRAAVENTEIGIVANTPYIARRLAERFGEVVRNKAFRLELEDTGKLSGKRLLWHRIIGSKTQTLTKDPNTTFLKRLGVNVVGLLPVEWLL